jgi:hypothetical protein
MNHRLVLLAALLAAAPRASHAQELGRLFFTPQERRAFDVQRKARAAGKPASTNAESRSARVDGYVLRSAAESTVWVNGEPSTSGARIARDAEGTGRVAIPSRQNGLRVGESYDSASGAVNDLLGGGELRVVPMKKAPR